MTAERAAPTARPWTRRAPSPTTVAALLECPLSVHLALTNAAYARALLRRSWRLPLGLARKVGGVGARVVAGGRSRPPPYCTAGGP